MISLSENINDLIIQDHHLIKGQQICYVNRLNSKEIYNTLIVENIATFSPPLYNNLFRDIDQD